MQAKILIILLASITLLSCKKEDPPTVTAEYDNTPYVLDHGHLDPPNLPEDNLLTESKVALGRMLFYDPILSKDNSQSCASCHLQENAFNDIRRFSIGVEGLPGTRQAMSIFNMAWNDNGFFWDGRAHLLRNQSLLPITDPLEMNETIENVVDKLRASDVYKNQFIRAFGDELINPERMSLAMEQFMLSIVSKDSKYDQYLKGEVTLTESEERGRALYFTEYNPFFPEFSGADCEHCHGGKNLENDQYMNNGLDPAGAIADVGRLIATGKTEDRGKFKVPSLRNIALTPPYMHDGRFNTLMEVIDHYDHGIKVSPTLDPALEATTSTGLMLSMQDKLDLVAFLNTFTDQTLLTNAQYSDPF